MLKIGDKVLIVNAGNGAYGANGLIGYVTDKPSKSGLIAETSGINIDINGYVWRVAKDFKYKLLEKSNREIQYEIC